MKEKIINWFKPYEGIVLFLLSRILYISAIVFIIGLFLNVLDSMDIYVNNHPILFLLTASAGFTYYIRNNK